MYFKCVYMYIDFSLALGNFPYTRVFPFAGMGKSYTSMENFPLWVNNFQYSMENFRRFFLECLLYILNGKCFKS